jgi:F-type H+-transporting ATPase subunit a
MEHPFMLLPWLLDMLHIEGLSHFAHDNPHVLYSWLVMAILIIGGKLAVGTVKMIPTGGQNLFWRPSSAGWKTLRWMSWASTAAPTSPCYSFTLLHLHPVHELDGLGAGHVRLHQQYQHPALHGPVRVLPHHIIGIKTHGFRVIVKHFMGPLLPLAPLIFFIEIIGFCARVMSLTFRLFGNIMGEDLVVAILFMLGGILLRARCP